MAKSKKSALHTYGTDMTKLAAMGKLDPVIGREKEIEQLIEAMMSRRKSNACIVGDAGIGKTAIVEALAIKIAACSVPPILAGKEVFSLDLGRLVAGSTLRGMFEERLHDVLDEVRESEGSVILFIDELHMIMSSRSQRTGAADILKPALARGDFMCIGATTLEEYTLHIERDAALKRRFQRILVREPSRDESVEILQGIIHKYEEHHGVKYTPSSIVAAVDLSKCYIRELFLPDKAIDLIDEAGARAQMQGKTDITKAEIEHVVSTFTGIPMDKISINESQRLLRIEDNMKRSLIGQDEAVAAVCDAILRARVGINDETKPIGCFLFTGPTGVGKTEMAKVLAREYFASEEAMVRLDMSEFTQCHSVSRLIGSPPGYSDHYKGGQLTEPIRRRPHSLVLFDEIEKAHEKVLNVLLQILDDGRLTDSKGVTVDFTNTIIILTSNIVGVGSSSFELRGSFKAELLNRFDQVVVFRPLEKKHIEKILEILTHEFCARVYSRKKIKVEVSQGLKEMLILEGYDERYGARALRRALARLVEDSLANEILDGAVTPGDSVMMDVAQGGEVTFVKASFPRQDLVIGNVKHPRLQVVKRCGFGYQYRYLPTSIDVSDGLAQVFDCI